MKIVALMRDLVSKGMSWEDAAMFAEKFEDGIEEAVERVRPARSNNAERQARFRSRHKNTVTGNVTNNATNNVIKEGPQTPKKDTPFPPLKGGTSPKVEGAKPEKPETTEPQKSLTVWISEIWDDTPSKGRQRSGKDLAHNALRAAIRKGADPASVRAGLAAYYASPDATKSDGEYAKGLHRAIQNGLWQAFEPPPDRPPPGGDDPWSTRLLRWQTSQYWNSEWGPKPGKPGYQGPEPQARAA